MFVAAVAMMQWLIWNPRVDVPEHADAILVLSYGDDRQQLGRQLAQQGISNNLVISLSSRVQRMRDPNDSLQFKDGAWLEECDTDYGSYRTFCIEPHPNTTVGEVSGFVQLAKEQDWNSVVVVTERSHLARAEMLMEGCYAGHVYGAASKPRGGILRAVWRSAYEMGAYVKNLVFSDC